MRGKIWLRCTDEGAVKEMIRPEEVLAGLLGRIEEGMDVGREFEGGVEGREDWVPVVEEENGRLVGRFGRCRV